ncbi:MAG: hypothetical protein GX174_03110 [Lentisphaerae bacterium]|nr:hypothetical protein [Lentisphaerota bacterium]
MIGCASLVLVLVLVLVLDHAGTAVPAGTAGTAGGWRPIPTTMPYFWREQIVDAASPPR